MAEEGIEKEGDKPTDLSHLPFVTVLQSSWREMWHLPALRSLLFIVAFNGFFHIGVFIVALPLLVQQVYGESVVYFSGLQLAFLAGTIVMTVVVIIKKGLIHPEEGSFLVCFMAG